MVIELGQLADCQEQTLKKGIQNVLITEPDRQTFITRDSRGVRDAESGDKFIRSSYDSTFLEELYGEIGRAQARALIVAQSGKDYNLFIAYNINIDNL